MSSDRIPMTRAGYDKLKAEGQTDQAKASAKQGVDDVKDAAHGVADSLRNEKH